MKKKYKLQNKKRFIIAICIILSVIISTTLLVTRRPEGKTDEVYKEIIVYPGDTLWDIAVEHFDGSTDVRKVIYNIKKLNEMSSSELSIGQIVKLPNQ